MSVEKTSSVRLSMPVRDRAAVTFPIPSSMAASSKTNRRVRQPHYPARENPRKADASRSLPSAAGSGDIALKVL